MEVVHQSSRRKKSSTKTNIVIAIIVHALMIAAGAFWAAHEGVLGAKLQNLAIFMVPKEKKPDEPAKKVEKVEVKKAEQPKAEQVAKAAPPAQKFIAPPPSCLEVVYVLYVELFK